MGGHGTLSSTRGPLFIAAGAALWATDALFRFPALSRVPAGVIVLIEHAFGVLLLLPLVARNPAYWLGLRPREWIAAFFVGSMGSALATLFFTTAFTLINPSVVILLQKTQPIFAISAAAFLLGERPTRSFYLWAPLAILAGAILSFPDLSFIQVLGEVNPSTRGSVLALSAAALWGFSTVVGKKLLVRVEPEPATFARLLFGFLTLAVFVPVAGLLGPTLEAIQTPRFLWSAAYMGWIPGLAALWLYYRGLKQTPARIATIVELVFPLTAVLVNWLVLDLTLSVVQLVAGALLLLAISRVSIRG
ncbi:MAG: DMT family transporter [Bdellovibrionota bacterium]